MMPEEQNNINEVDGPDLIEDDGDEPLQKEETDIPDYDDELGEDSEETEDDDE